MVERLAVVREARGAVGHHALALGGAHRGAEVGLVALAEQALAAFGGVERNDVIAGLHGGDAFTHGFHDAGALVAQHDGKEAFRIVTGQGEGIGRTDPGMGDAHQHFAFAGRFDIDLDDLQGLAGGKGDGGAGFEGGGHGGFSS